jgi:WhiB family redox-sensing transcriptional regulator
MDWRLSGACVDEDPDRWFPADEDDADDVKDICRSCPVRDVCLEQALANRERAGIWGALTTRERDALRKPGTAGPHRAAAKEALPLQIIRTASPAGRAESAELKEAS